MGSDGTNPRRLTNHSGRDEFPSWSPDGRRLAFESYRDGNREIYVMGSDGTNPHRLTNHAAWDVEPSWSPDGRHIAFVSNRDNWEIYVMGSDGTNPRRLTHGQRHLSVLVSGWPPHRLPVLSRRQLGDLRDGFEWQQPSSPDPPRPTTSIRLGLQMAATLPSCLGATTTTGRFT